MSVLAKFVETCTDPRLEVCHLVHEDRARGGTDFYVLAILTGGKIGCSPCFLPLSSLHVTLTLPEDWNQTTAKYASNPHLMGSPNYYLRFRFWASQRIRHYLAPAFKFTEMEPKASASVPGLALCSSVCLRYQPLPEYFTDPEIEKQLALAPSFTYPWYFHKALFILHPPYRLVSLFLCFTILQVLRPALFSLSRSSALLHETRVAHCL